MADLQNEGTQAVREALSFATKRAVALAALAAHVEGKPEGEAELVALLAELLRVGEALAEVEADHG